jgi:hypothetical protein
MKRILVPVAVVLLTTGLAWAGDPAGATVTPDEPLAPAAPAEVPPEDGGCVLPDLAGLTAEDQDAAFREAGFVVATVDAAPPICPTPFSCSSITNCGAGPACSLTDLGPCCASPAGIRCCPTGTIKVVRCPCQCTGNPCSFVCAGSNNVQTFCS